MREIFLSHSVSTLKKEISKTNIKGYSTMKKAQIVDLMVKNQARFSHIKMNQRKQKKIDSKKTEPRKKMLTKTETPKKKQRLIVKKKPTPKDDSEPPRPPKPSAPKPQKKDKKTLLLEKETPKLYKKLETEFFNNKKTMGRIKALTLFKQKINKAYEDLLELKKLLKEKSKLVEKKKKAESLPQLKKLTGLTKAEANKLDPAALFGLLPSELGKKILNPKQTGIKVGGIKIKDYDLDDFSDYNQDEFDDSLSNATRDMMFKNDFTSYAGYRVLTKRESKYYLKNYLKYSSGEYDEKMETIEEKIRDELSEIYLKLITKALKEFKKKEKGRVDTIKKFNEEFNAFWDNY